MTALAAAGYAVYGINPLQAARYRERHSVSGAKSDAGDAHVLADMVRTDAHQLRLIAADSPAAQAVKVVARAHKTLIWERTRQVRRLRYQLRDFFPAALEAYADLDAPDVLELLARAPEPASAARLTTAQISAALKRAGRRGTSPSAPPSSGPRCAPRNWPSRPRSPPRALPWSGPWRRSSPPSTSKSRCWKARWRHIFASTRTLRSSCLSPGWGRSSAPGCSAEFGDDPTRYASAKARKNYAATSPITRQSGRKKTVMARYVHNDRLRDALGRQAYSALTASPGARAYYDQLRARNIAHDAALRQLANRLVGILHGCLKTRTLYDEATAWPQRNNGQFPTAA